VLLFALAVPLARRKGDAARAALMRFCLGVTVLFAIVAVTLCLFYGTSTRYQAEFQAWLAWLAGVGLLEIAARTQGTAELRLAGGAVLAVTVAFSSAFGFLRSFQHEGDHWYFRGQALARRGEKEAALAAYEKALDWRPDLRGARRQAALLAEALDRLPDARRHYEFLVREEPGDAEAQNNLGSVLHRLRRPAEALPHFQAALARDAKFAPAAFNLGLVLFELQRLPEAAEAFRAAVRLEPNDAMAHYLLARVLLQLGRDAEAQAEHRTAQRLDPAVPPLQR
jgi:tetratricopeptide (TPR) repeat protein